MGIGAGLYMYDVVAEKFTFAISSPDEFGSFLETKHVARRCDLVTPTIASDETCCKTLRQCSRPTVLSK